MKRALYAIFVTAYTLALLAVSGFVCFAAYDICTFAR